MPDNAPPHAQQAAQAILAYLAGHPRAADSAQGIASWWLPQMGLDLPLDVVDLALDDLVQRGEIRRTVLGDGQAIYRAAPH